MSGLAVRPGDRATRTILAMQDELTALGLLTGGDTVRRGRPASVKAIPQSAAELQRRAQARERAAEDAARAARLAAAEASAAQHYATLRRPA